MEEREGKKAQHFENFPFFEVLLAISLSDLWKKL
jgi:hypothetical protein